MYILSLLGCITAHRQQRWLSALLRYSKKLGRMSKKVKARRLKKMISSRHYIQIFISIFNDSNEVRKSILYLVVLKRNELNSLIWLVNGSQKLSVATRILYCIALWLSKRYTQQQTVFWEQRVSTENWKNWYMPDNHFA